MHGDALSDPSTQPSPDRWVFRGLMLLLFWLPLPWGSKPPFATAIFGLAVALLVTARLLQQLRGLPAPPLTGSAKAAMAFWFAWLAWIAAQAMPLPGAATALAGSGSAAISILPGATLDQLALSSAYIGLFWLVLATAGRNRVRQRRLMMIVVLSGLFQALYGSVMTLSGLELGFFEPKSFALDRATGTFINQNHLAGYLELALAAGIGLVLADLRPTEGRSWREMVAGAVDLALSRRMRVRVMLAIMVVALVLTRSRGGNLAFFVALAVCGSIFMLVRNPKYFGKSLIFFLSLFLVDLLIISEHYGLEKLAQRIESTELDTEQRTLAFRDLQPVLHEHAATGSGLGTFAAAFSPHRSAGLHGHFDHAHNDHLEFIIETGFIGYALLGAIAVLTLAHGLAVIRRRPDPMAAALAFAGSMGLVSLLIHGVVDFNLRIPATAATLVALMALALSCSAVPRRSRLASTEP